MAISICKRLTRPSRLRPFRLRVGKPLGAFSAPFEDRGTPYIVRFMAHYLLAVDPSLTCSGWAMFTLGKEELCAVGKVRSLPPSLGLSERLKDLQTKVETLLRDLRLSNGDIMVCEAPTTMRDPRAAIKVEQVRCIFETVARGKGLTVPGRVNPRSVQSEIMGLRGRQLARRYVKEIAGQIASRLYGKALDGLGFMRDETNLKRNQDIVDAVLVGSLVLSWRRSAELSGSPLEALFAETRIRRARRAAA